MGSCGPVRQPGKVRQCGSPDLCDADIKGPCTWLFPNHYRRTINYGHSLIAIFCKWKCWNQVEVVEIRLGGGGTKQTGQTGQTSPNIWKRGHFNKNPSSSSSPLLRDGGKTKNRKFHINTKRANVNNQMNDT